MSITKLMLTTSVVLSLSSAAFADTNATGPKWCSADSLSKVEKVICDDAVLAASDVLMSGLYKEVMSYRGKEGHEGNWPGEVISNQRDWVVKRNESTDRVKILDAYMARIPELYGVLQNRLSD